MDDVEDRASLFSFQSINASPDTLAKLVKRVRAMTLKLLPVQVELGTLNEPSSRYITPRVIAAYENAAGDFGEALPYCLLRARQQFIRDANHNAADFDENMGRAIACEVLARRIVHRAPPARLASIMSTRYRHMKRNGEKSDLTSALELAIDTQCTIFLSSSESQHIVDCLWRGDLVQRNNERGDIDYVPYDEIHEHTFWDHFNPSRIGVPRYQNFFRVTIWLLFLVVYSQAVRQPLERLAVDRKHLDGWEIAMYIMALSFSIEEFHKFYKILRLFTWRAFSFWMIVSMVTDGLLVAAFALRMAGLNTHGDEARKLHMNSFQVLSFVSPFIWMKLLTVVDGYKYVGTMQICVARMLRESGIFFSLLSILAVGFAQGLYGLDAADGATDHGAKIINSLVQALLQSPDFGGVAENSWTLILYYLWNVATTVILLNVLVSLFSSAYTDIVDNAEAQYLAFFASKTVNMIRAPDSYVYPAPFNLFEVFLVAPLEPFLAKKTYSKVNKWVMTIVFFIPLTFIAFWETTVDRTAKEYIYDWFSLGDEEPNDEDDPSTQDPEVEDEQGLKISKVPFAELVKGFPDPSVSGETSIKLEIHELRKQLDTLLEKLDEKP